YVWGVPGWSASGRAVDDVAGQISSGTSFPIVRGGKLVEGTLSSGPSKLGHRPADTPVPPPPP
ncbi:MAG TPA: hypothetical protein VNC78_09240, partial [Actinomycetota bacterium]|nr:hypothetical protein [Actinomycetota bacterium]